jgi:CRP-like cAMP-binding protein
MARLTEISITAVFALRDASSGAPWPGRSPSDEATAMIHESPLSRKLGAFVALSARSGHLERLHARRRRFQRAWTWRTRGRPTSRPTSCAEGWVCSYKLLRGGTRQIVDFQVPGDFLGLRSVLFRTADHNIEPVTAVEASVVLSSDLLDAFARTPRLATAVLWAASRDEAMVVEHLVGVGRRNALERTAHYLLELGARLRLVGLATAAGYACPLSQYQLADALGLSAVHVNRVLRQLREEGLLTFQGGPGDVRRRRSARGPGRLRQGLPRPRRTAAAGRLRRSDGASTLIQISTLSSRFLHLPR